MQVSFVFLIASKVREKALTLEGNLNEIMLLEWRGFHGPHISICSVSLSLIPELQICSYQSGNFEKVNQRIS